MDKQLKIGKARGKIYGLKQTPLIASLQTKVFVAKKCRKISILEFFDLIWELGRDEINHCFADRKNFKQT